MGKAPASKKASPKAVRKVMKEKRLRKGSLRKALMSGLKRKGGRQDLKFEDAPAAAASAMKAVPIKERAGYPLVRAKGSVDPKNWRTVEGKEVIVDFARAAWLPDDWGQGVKTTNATSRSTGGGGGTYTVFISPEGRVFYHRWAAEDYFGRKFTAQDGFRGQLRMAWLQGKQLQVSWDVDSSFFKVLTRLERRFLPKKDELHFCIISARRTGSLEGVKDIATVQSAFLTAGVSPTWYVDAPSLEAYKALGLDAVVGGKLTEARNKALKDAKKKGKACVQVSDDISAWEYHDGKQAVDRSDEAANIAHANATRYVISPVAAARFILAKMRSVTDGPRPRLGGVYMLGSCSRTFGGAAFSRRHFILGDFFVADDSPVRFDEEMTLKEDYDFTCGHIKAHGSVMRCNRMTVHAKHYSNSGGACANRDAKGMEERRNIDILNRKWPGAFRPNPKRKNEVILAWKGDTVDQFEVASGAGKKHARD